MKPRTQSGQSLIEFALVLPFLVFLILSVLEWGLVLYDKAVITNAAREGARAGIVAGGPQKAVEDVVTDYCKNNLVSFSSNDPQTSSTPRPPTPTINDTLTVTVTYNYTWLCLPKFITLANPVKLGATVTMHYE